MTLLKASHLLSKLSSTVKPSAGHMPCHVPLLMHSRWRYLFWFGQRSRSDQDCTTTIYLLFRVTFLTYYWCWGVWYITYLFTSYIRLEYRLKRKLFYTATHYCYPLSDLFSVVNYKTWYTELYIANHSCPSNSAADFLRLRSMVSILLTKSIKTYTSSSDISTGLMKQFTPHSKHSPDWSALNLIFGGALLHHSHNIGPILLLWRKGRQPFFVEIFRSPCPLCQ